MRNRQIYELTYTRSRRQDSMESDFSSYTGQTLNISQINQSERPKYFEDVDNQDAPFSHNTMISKQIEYRCMNRDYIQFCDQYLQLQNENILVNVPTIVVQTFEINNQNSISIFINIKIVDSSDISGLWISQDIAQTYNTEVFLIECCITDEINEQNKKLITYTQLLADELFLTCQNIQQLNQFISLFKAHHLLFQEFNIAELEQKDLDVSQIHELNKICKYVKFVSMFPSNIIDFQWQYFDFKHQNCKFIPQKSWKGYQIDSSMFLFMIQIISKFLMEYPYITDVLIDIMHSKVFEKLIDSKFDELYTQYELNIHQYVIPMLPLTNLIETLTQLRMKIQGEVYEELSKFKNYTYFKLCIRQLQEKINILETYSIKLNEQLLDCFCSQKITDYLNEIYRNRIFNYEKVSIENWQNETQDIFIKFFQLFTHQNDVVEYQNIIHFFQITYSTFLRDLIFKIGDVHERELNKYYDVMKDQIQQLLSQRQIIEEKAICVQMYNEILRKEIDSLQKQISNTKLQNEKLQPSFLASQTCVAQLHTLEVQIFQFNIVLQKQFMKMQKKNKKK